MRRHLHLLSLLLGLLLPLAGLRAQEAPQLLRLLILHGETSKPVSDVICQVLDSTKRRTSFAQSDRTGQVKLRITEHDRYVTFALLGFAKREISLGELRGEKPIIRLQPKTTQLREVHVKAEPITVHNDTLRYRVKAFAGKGDRYLEDVLKKLPGLRVHDDGRIEYQGKSINKFYIEGMDPLGTNYKQASRNIPSEAVEQVDVIEHNQHKRILQGKVFDEHAALNIRLHSKYRFRPFGEVMAGAGVPLGQGAGRAFLMQVGRGNQLITGIKANNIGVNLQSDFTEPIDFMLLDTYIPPPSLFLAPALSGQRPPLSEKRYLRNHALLWHANDIQRLGEYATLRLQAKGYHDRQPLESERLTDYLGTQPFSLYEGSSLTSRPNHYRLNLHYELNAPKQFLLVDLTAGTERQAYTEHLDASGGGYDLSLSQRPRWLSADLQGNVYLGGHLVSLHSTSQRYTAPEHLYGRATAHGEPINEVRELSQVATRNRASAVFRWGKFSLSSGLQVDASGRRYRQDASHSAEAVSYRQYTLGPELSLGLSLKKTSFSLSSPLQLRHEALQLGTRTEERTYLSLAPSASVRHTFSAMSALTIRGSYSEVPDVDSYYVLGGRARQSYRLSYASLERLSRKHSWRASTRYTFHNPVELFFTHLDFSYQHSTSDYYRDLSYTLTQSWSHPVDNLHHKRSYTAQVTVDKSIAPLGLSLRGEVSYSGQEAIRSLNGRALPVRSEGVMTKVNLGWTKVHPLELHYAGEASWMRIHLPASSPASLWRLAEELKATYSPTKAWIFILRLEHTMNATTSQHYQHSFFLDAEARWLVGKRCQLEAHLTNLTDERAYSITSLTASERIRYALPLRGRELLVSCSFRL